MSAERKAELVQQVEDLTGLVVDLLTREPLDEEPPEPDREYDEAVDPDERPASPGRPGDVRRELDRLSGS